MVHTYGTALVRHSITLVMQESPGKAWHHMVNTSSPGKAWHHMVNTLSPDMAHIQLHLRISTSIRAGITWPLHLITKCCRYQVVLSWTGKEYSKDMQFLATSQYYNPNTYTSCESLKNIYDCITSHNHEEDFYKSSL